MVEPNVWLFDLRGRLNLDGREIGGLPFLFPGDACLAVVALLPMLGVIADRGPEVFNDAFRERGRAFESLVVGLDEGL